MDKYDVVKTVKKQLAIDMNCSESDFESCEIVVTEAAKNPGRNMFGDCDRMLNGCCFGGSAVFSVNRELISELKTLFAGHDPSWIFEPKTLVALEEKLYLSGHNISDMYQYYVPDPEVEKTEEMFDIQWIEQDELKQYLDLSVAQDALGFDEGAPDILAVAAKDNGKIVGMAAASLDSPLFWQIGAQVLPEYREQGIATNLVGLLKDETLKRGAIPYFGSFSTHAVSQSVGYAAGFFPCWSKIVSSPRTDEFLGYR